MSKKKITLIIILLLLLIALVAFSYKHLETYFMSDLFLKENLDFAEDNSKVFSIDKITYFSSCNAKIATNSNSSFTISDLYQYTDIAIFINNIQEENEELTHKNTLKTVSITDINYSSTPKSGTPSIYYKNINDFAKAEYSEENKIDNSITFDTTSEDTLDYSKPILYNNCANPITLCYINNNIVKNYTLSNKISNIAYNGSLLKSCGVTLNSIACTIQFNINITNNLDETYSCPMSLNIPVKTETNTLYDGSLTVKDTTNFNFIKTN